MQLLTTSHASPPTEVLSPDTKKKIPESKIENQACAPSQLASLLGYKKGEKMVNNQEHRGMPRKPHCNRPPENHEGWAPLIKIGIRSKRSQRGGEVGNLAGLKIGDVIRCVRNFFVIIREKVFKSRYLFKAKVGGIDFQGPNIPLLFNTPAYNPLDRFFC